MIHPYLYTVLQIYFEESSYSIMEGSDLMVPILLNFTNNQNPFTLTISVESIDGGELGVFINTTGRGSGSMDNVFISTLGNNENL